MKHLNIDRGFSLIETLVAITILSLITLSAAMIMTSYFSGSEKISQLSSRMNVLMKFREKMKDDLFHAIPRPSGPRLNRVIFAGNNQEDCFLIFTRSSSFNSADKTRSDIENVKYCTEDTSIIRVNSKYPDFESENQFRKIKYNLNIKNLYIEFFSDGIWNEDWKRNHEIVEKTAPSLLPSIVKIKWTNLETNNKSVSDNEVEILFQVN